MADAIRLVAFDLYGTLVDTDEFVNLLRPYTGMPEAMADAWRQRQLGTAMSMSASGRYENYDRITLTALTEVAPRFHLRLEPAVIKYLMDCWARLPAYDDVLPALQRLAERGIPAAVLTNAVPHTAKNALKFAGIDEYIADIFSADAVRVYKPKMAAYAQLLSGLPANEVLFVSGNDWDAAGARQAGIHTAWVNRKRARSVQKAERVLKDLTELDALLLKFELTSL